MKHIALICCLLATPAIAQERTLNNKLENGMPSVIVWRDYKALTEADDLISAGIAKRNPELAYRLMACRVPVGTKFIVTDSTIGTRTILVTSGESIGCRGTVHIESVD